jgi:hypothetical protein
MNMRRRDAMDFITEDGYEVKFGMEEEFQQ